MLQFGQGLFLPNKAAIPPLITQTAPPLPRATLLPVSQSLPVSVPWDFRSGDSVCNGHFQLPLPPSLKPHQRLSGLL